MKRNILILIFVFSSAHLFSQNKSVFNIKEVLIDKPKALKEVKVEIKDKEEFYEDENYIITKSCKGEWGGSAWFKNKKSGIIYSCQSSCPKSINKIEGKYIITSSLAHLSGHSEIIMIENPEKLEQYKKPKPRKDENGTSFYYAVDLESKSTQGVKTLWSESKILTLLSFLYNNKLYHVMNIKDMIFVTTLEKNKIVVTDTISKKRIWSHHSVKKINDSHLVLYLGRRSQKNEYLEIKDNNIKLVRYK